MFKIGDKKPEKKEVEQNNSVDENIFVQSQFHDGDQASLTPPRFSFCWVLRYDNGKDVVSEWTPSIEPSIKKTLDLRPKPSHLSIIGKSISLCEMEFARFKFDMVNGWGYIAEQTQSSRGKPYILGMWVELTGNKMIKIYVNGKIKEILK